MPRRWVQRAGIVAVITTIWIALAGPAWAMPISVRLSTGPVLALDVEPSTSVDEVKVMVESATGIPAVDQVLMFGGQVMEDGRSLSDYNVRRGDTVLAIVPSPVVPVPVWHQSYGRQAQLDPCESGWDPSWAWWPHGNTGGFVCNRAVPAYG